MSRDARITAGRELKQSLAVLHAFIPRSAKLVSIDKFDFWLQAYHPDSAQLFVKVLKPALGQTLSLSLQIDTALRIRYIHDTPHLFLDQRYRVEQVYSLLNLTAKPFTVQFFLVAQDATGRSCLLQIVRRSPFKRDLYPAAKRFGLASK